MRRLRVVASIVLLTVFAVPAQPDLAPIPPMIEVLGSVSNATRPVANALVIALNLKDLAAIQTYSLADGTFSLPKLPAGVYRIIAVKQGFAPAMATVVPNKSNHNVALSLENEKKAKKQNLDAIWQIRASLPSDILREIDLVTQEETAPVMASFNLPRMRAEMVSMTGVGTQTTGPSFAQTSLGVQSRLTDNWQLGIRGEMHRVENPTGAESFGDPAAESSVMSMELRSSPHDAYKVDSAMSSWRYREDATGRLADVRSHGFRWQHGTAHVGVRYLAQENLFATAPFGSNTIEVSGGTSLLQTRRSDIGLSVRVLQENIRNSPVAPMRTAELTANGSLEVVPELIVRYGLSSRRTLDRTELAPRTGLQWKINDHTSFVADAMFKAVDPFRDEVVLPTIGSTFDDGRLLPRYAVSFGLVNGDEDSSHVSAIATITAVESPFRVVFHDGTEQFWDAIYVDSGDVRRDVRVSGRRDFGNRFAVDFVTSAGTATPANPALKTKAYITSDLQSIFFPTGTSLLLSYRGLSQPQPQGADYRSERFNVRMAQSLHLPVDLKVLLGLELARAENSPFLVDVVDPSVGKGLSRKYIGGLAVNF